jgi:transcription antitermination factor NusG
MKTSCSEFVWRIFEPGTQVVVDEGPLQGLRGTVLGVDDNVRLIVAVTLLRGLIPVALDPGDVHCIDQTETFIPQLLTH